MYKVKIVTKYNTIIMEVEDTNTPEMQEIFNQPYVLEVYIETMKHFRKEKELTLKK